MFDWFRRPRQQREEFFEPWSDREAIYDFIVRHLDGSGRLSADAESLPDESEAAPRGIRFAPGAIDGIFTHQGNPAESKVRVAELHRAIKRAAEKRSPEAIRELHQVTRADSVVGDLDPLIDLFRTRRDVGAAGLVALAQWLARRAPDRNSVKVAVALLGLVPNDDSIRIVQVLGKHEEFTLFAAVAIANTLRPPDRALWSLAKDVDGWGRIQAIRRLNETTDPEIKSWLLREGYRNTITYEYTALICAEAGGLVEALAGSSVDDTLICGAGQILCTLMDCHVGPAPEIDDYSGAAQAVRQYVAVLGARATTLDDLTSAKTIRRFLDEDADWTKRASQGWTEELRATLRVGCDEIIDDVRWEGRVRDGLISEDPNVLHTASILAPDVGIDPWPYQFDRLKRSPKDDRAPWYFVCETRDLDRFRQVVDLAVNTLRLDRIATGPGTNLGLGKEFAEHRILDWVLQSLPRFPGEAWVLIKTGLASPVVRNRNMALRAFGQWGQARWGPEVEATLRTALDREPDDRVKVGLRRVLAGERIELPGEAPK